jgi:hypothetical protein
MTDTDAHTQFYVQLSSTPILLKVSDVQDFGYYYYFRLIESAKIQNSNFWMRSGNITVNQRSKEVK